MIVIMLFLLTIHIILMDSSGQLYGRDAFKHFLYMGIMTLWVIVLFG